MKRDVRCILGLPVDNLTEPEAVSQVLSMVEEYKQDARPRYVATVNVDFLANTWGWRSGQPKDPVLLRALRDADMITADGMPTVWLSQLLGASLKGRVTGVDLCLALAERAATIDLRLYLLGASEEVLERCSQTLLHQYPGLCIAGQSSPWIDLNDSSGDESILEEIHASGADVLLLGLGNPKQELWYQRVRERLQVPVTLGIGGTFNFIAGTVRRAPVWMQRAGLEWLYRLSQEPRRLWRRYGIGLIKLAALTFPLFFERLWPVQRVSALRPLRVSIEGAQRRIELPSILTQPSLAELSLPHPSPDLTFSFSQVERIDLEGAGQLLETIRRARLEGAQVAMTNLSPATKRWLHAHRLGDLITQEEHSA